MVTTYMPIIPSITAREVKFELLGAVQFVIADSTHGSTRDALHAIEWQLSTGVHPTMPPVLFVHCMQPAMGAVVQRFVSTSQ